MDEPRSSDNQESQDRAQPFEEALDALRTNLVNEPEENRWRRDISLLGLLAAIFGFVAWYALLADRAQPITVEIQVEDSLSQELEWIKPGFEQALIAYAHAGKRVRLTRPLAEEGARPTNPLLDLGTATQSSQATLNIELTELPSSDTIQANLLLTEGDQIKRAVLTGHPSALADLASRTSMHVFEWLGVDLYTSTETRSAELEYPHQPDAARHYVLGLQALRRGEGRTATTELAKAQEIAPENPMINAALAEAFDFLGYRAQALQYIKVAFDQSGRMSREKQLSIEARLRLIEHSWNEAESLYAALFAFYPSDISYGLALAEAQFLGSRTQDALATLTQLRQNQAFIEDPRIDLLESRIWWRFGDWSKGVSAAERAAEKAELLGHSGIQARALVRRADMDGDPEGSGLTIAMGIFKLMNDPYGESQVLREQGDRHTAAGRLAEGIEAYNASEALSMRLGNDAERDAATQAKAIALDLNGQLELGYETKLSLLESSSARGQNIRAAIVRENIGISALKLGRMEESIQWFDEALEEFIEHTDVIGIAWHPYQKGRVLARMGALEQARTLFEQALENAKQHPEGYLELHTQYEIARLDVFEGRPNAAALLNHLVQRYDEEDLNLDTGDTLLVLARHKAMSGNLEEAFADVMLARQIFIEADAHYYLTRAETQRLRLGDLDACDDLEKLADNSEHTEVAMMAIAALQVCAGRNDDIPYLLQEAQRLKLFEPQLALTALTNGEAAKELAYTHGWNAHDLWPKY